MLGILLREKPTRIFLALKNEQMHVSKLARQCGVTYVHLTKLIPKMQEAGWVKAEKIGKKKMLGLTDKGMEIAQALEELKRRLEMPKEVKS